MIKIIFLSLLVSGCSLFISDDYFSQKIARIDTSMSNDISVETVLLKGRNELFFYVKGYDCNSRLNGDIAISINVSGDGKISNLNLSDLTWPRRGSELMCVPLGFYTSKNARPFSMALEKNEKVTFNFKNNAATSGSVVEVWIAHNSKLSLERVEKN